MRNRATIQLLLVAIFLVALVALATSTRRMWIPYHLSGSTRNLETADVNINQIARVLASDFAATLQLFADRQCVTSVDVLSTFPDLIIREDVIDRQGNPYLLLRHNHQGGAAHSSSQPHLFLTAMYFGGDGVPEVGRGDDVGWQMRISESPADLRVSEPQYLDGYYFLTGARVARSTAIVLVAWLICGVGLIVLHQGRPRRKWLHWLWVLQIIPCAAAVWIWSAKATSWKLLRGSQSSEWLWPGLVIISFFAVSAVIFGSLWKANHTDERDK